MCDMDGGSDSGYDTGSDMDISEGTDMDVSSDVDVDSESSFEGFDDVDVTDEVGDFSDSVENFDAEIESFDVFDDIDDISAETFANEDFVDVNTEMSEEVGWGVLEEQDSGFTGLEDVMEPEMTVTTEELEGWAAESEDPEFGDKIDALVESGRLEVLEMNETDESEEDDVKVLTREITPEILESRERDTEEVLDNYRENLQNRGVSDEQIEAFVNQERDKINAEYESLDRGDTSSNIYNTPMDWDAVADSLSAQEHGESGTEGLGAVVSEVGEYSENADLSEMQEDLQDNFSLSELPDIDELQETGDIDVESPEDLAAETDVGGVQNIESNEDAENIEETEDAERVEEATAETENIDEMAETHNEVELQESVEIEESTETAEDKGMGESAEIAEGEGVGESAEIAESEETNESVDIAENEEIAGHAEIEQLGEGIQEVGEVEESVEFGETEDTYEILELTQDMEVSQEVSDEMIDETQEMVIDYDEIYEGIEQEALEQGFEDIDIYADTERLDSSLEQFEASNWEGMSLGEQKESIADLAEYVEETIGFETPPAN